jgi:amino acid transporter
MSKIKKVLLGHSLKTEELGHEKLSRLWGLPIMASDAVSSVAYAVEEILLVLVPMIGFAAYNYAPGVILSIIVLLLILAFSYSQIISHYPNGGGAYVVSKENLGSTPALTAAAALIVDYILTVAVSISAATTAISAAFPALHPYRVIISVVFVSLITLGNLRGIRESSRIFGIPTYAFIVMMGIMIAAGFIRLFTGSLEPVVYSGKQLTGILPSETYKDLLLLLLLKAFSSGCSALTGIEAVSNAVPSFKDPAQRTAKNVLYMLSGVIIIIFGGTGLLAARLNIMPVEGTTVTAQIANAVFGQNIFFFLVQLTTALILILAANTAYNGLPLLLYILAHDGYVPRQFSHRGAKLSFSNGIIFIFAAASLLIVAFDSSPHKLIPLYSVGVFVSFTLSQFGMFRKWLTDKEKGWQYKSLINLFGSIVTAVGTIIVFAFKFTQGAWMLAIVMPALIFLMSKIKRHYDNVKAAVELREFAPYYPSEPGTPARHCIVLMQNINKATLKAVNYANTISSNVAVLHVCRYPKHAEELRKEWADMQIPLRLEIIENPYRDIVNPLMGYIYELEKELGHGENITIVMIKYITSKWYDKFLHSQTEYFLEQKLSRFKNVSTVLLPYHYTFHSILTSKIELDD